MSNTAVVSISVSVYVIYRSIHVNRFHFDFQASARVVNMIRLFKNPRKVMIQVNDVISFLLCVALIKFERSKKDMFMGEQGG